MSTEAYLAALRALGVSNIAAGQVFGLSPRQAQRLAAGETPVSKPIAKLIKLALEKGLTAAEIEAL